MNNRIEALRIASRAFRILSLGGKMTTEELKRFGDMCALAMPAKYRFDKKELAEMESYAKGETKMKCKKCGEQITPVAMTPEASQQHYADIGQQITCKRTWEFHEPSQPRMEG